MSDTVPKPQGISIKKRVKRIWPFFRGSPMPWTFAIGGTVEEAFMTYWRLQRACELQIAMDSLNGPNRPIAASVYEAVPQREAAIRQPQPGEEPLDIFGAMLRKAGIHYEALA